MTEGPNMGVGEGYTPHSDSHFFSLLLMTSAWAESAGSDELFSAFPLENALRPSTSGSSANPSIASLSPSNIKSV